MEERPQEDENPAASPNRFSWRDGDVTLLDEDGQPMTTREALEQQLMRCRSEVAEDVVADTEHGLASRGG